MKFYLHYEIDTLKIKSVNAIPDIGMASIEIDEDIASKFLMGEENFIWWQLDEHLNLTKITDTPAKLSRVELGHGIYEVMKNSWDDVRIEILEDEILIYYDAEKLQTSNSKVRLYFTREHDMSYLKYAFSFDVNILDKILQDGQWPNPISIKMEDTDDLSIYAVNGPLTVSLYERE